MTEFVALRLAQVQGMRSVDFVGTVSHYGRGNAI